MIRTLAKTIASAAVLIASLTSAEAQQKVRFAYLKTTTLLPFFIADQKGYFKAEGLDVEFIAVPGGPAVAAAIAGGSADIGYAAPTPIAIARENGQPYKFFIGLEKEHHPGTLWGNMIASERSGVTKLADLKGKTITMGPPGGLCELTVRDYLSTVGIKFDEIKALHQPFPTMQAALEVGNADAACIVEPFFTAAMASKAKPVKIASGYIAPHPKPYLVDGVFAKEDWIKGNAKAIEGIKKAVLKAGEDLAKDKSLVVSVLKEEFRFPPALVESVRLDMSNAVAITGEAFEPIITRMKQHGMLKSNMKADDLVHTGK